MKKAIPEHYYDIEEVEIKLKDGRILYIQEEDAVKWAHAVDWGVRTYQANDIIKHGQITEFFNWQERRRRGYDD